MESEFKVSAWANEIVLSQYSSLSREQTEEIWHEFNVWATTRVIRKAKAKKKALIRLSRHSRYMENPRILKKLIVRLCNSFGIAQQNIS